MKPKTFCLVMVALLLQVAPAPAAAGALVADGFDGAAGAPPDAAAFEWGGEVAQDGAGQLALQTWTANQSWLRSQAGAAPEPGQTLLLQIRAAAYAEPAVYGDFQPRGLRVGSDADNAAEFYSVYGTTLGMRVRKDGVESLSTYPLSSGVNAMHDYEISVTTTAVCFKVDGVLAGTFTTNLPTGVLNVYVSTFDGYFGNVPMTLDRVSLVLTNAEVQGTAAGPAGTVVAWGGCPPVPAGLSNIIALAPGDSHTSALKSDGTVMAWGNNNYYGQTNVPANLSGIIAIAAGREFTAVLNSNGTVSGWGRGDLGQLSPPAGLSNVTAIATGDHHTMALRNDGTVVAWGNNYYGQIAVPAGLSNVIAIVAGRENSFAMKLDGTLTGWGINDFGQTTIPSGLRNVTAMAAGPRHTLALKSDSTVAAWGINDAGQVTGTRSSHPWLAAANPVVLNGVVLSNVTALAAGIYHSVALKRDGTLVAWGGGGNGQTVVPGGLNGVLGIKGATWYTAAVVAIAPPSMAMPPANLNVAVGFPATFTVNAAGTIPLSYQWLKEGLSVSGATNTTLTVNNAQPYDVGSFQVVITNAYGCITSSPAALTIDWVPPTVSLAPPTNGFGVTITGSSNLIVVIEACTNLANPVWHPLQTNTLVGGTAYFSHPQWTNAPSQFYRLRSP